jgi:hypothetical protein
MVGFIGMYTAFAAVILVVVIFFNTFPLSLFVLVGLGLWGWRMLATRVPGAGDAKPLIARASSSVEKFSRAIGSSLTLNAIIRDR